MARTSILVIDDNEADFELVREVLPDSIVLTWAEDTNDARQCLLKSCFDLILLDHGLPGTNGLTFLNELMRDYPDCPVIMLTGREDPTLAISALQMGARNYLVKNEVFEHLIPALEEILAVPLSAKASSSDRFIDSAAKFYPRLLDTISDGCLVLDRDGIVTFANSAGQSFADFLPGSLLGRDILDAFSPRSKDEMRAELTRAQHSRMPLSSVFQAYLGDGVIDTPVRISMHTLHARECSFENAILIVYDLTEQVRARELRDDLVRAMVHDLRTPLDSIIGAVELLAHMHRGDNGSGELLGLIELSAGNMLGMINQILDVERLEHGTLPLTFGDGSLETLIRQAIRAQSHLASNKELTLECHIHSADVAVRMDSDLIRRVLQNLLANAIRHSPVGETVAVALSQPLEEADVDAHCLLVSVRDNGPGINTELAERLFEKFVRGSGGGSGLGLTFCKFAIEAHGGDIWFDTVPGQGTVFWFTLPSGTER